MLPDCYHRHVSGIFRLFMGKNGTCERRAEEEKGTKLSF